MDSAALQDTYFFRSPIDTLVNTLDEESTHVTDLDAIEAYNVLYGRLRVTADLLNNPSVDVTTQLKRHASTIGYAAPPPALFYLKSHSHNLLACMRRDIRLAKSFRPQSLSSEEEGEWSIADSVHYDETLGYSRLLTPQDIQDSRVVSIKCQEAIRLAGLVWAVPDIYALFPGPALTSLLRQTLTLTLTPRLPILNAQKIHSMVFASLASNALSPALLVPRIPFIVQALEKAIKEEGCGEVSKILGLKAIHTILTGHPATLAYFIPLLSTVLANLTSDNQAYKVYAALALSGYAVAKVALLSTVATSQPSMSTSMYASTANFNKSTTMIPRTTSTTATNAGVTTNTTTNVHEELSTIVNKFIEEEGVAYSKAKARRKEEENGKGKGKGKAPSGGEDEDEMEKAYLQGVFEGALGFGSPGTSRLTHSHSTTSKSPHPTAAPHPNSNSNPISHSNSNSRSHSTSHSSSNTAETQTTQAIHALSTLATLLVLTDHTTFTHGYTLRLFLETLRFSAGFHSRSRGHTTDRDRNGVRMLRDEVWKVCVWGLGRMFNAGEGLPEGVPKDLKTLKKKMDVFERAYKVLEQELGGGIGSALVWVGMSVGGDDASAWNHGSLSASLGVNRKEGKGKGKDRDVGKKEAKEKEEGEIMKEWQRFREGNVGRCVEVVGALLISSVSSSRKGTKDTWKDREGLKLLGALFGISGSTGLSEGTTTGDEEDEGRDPDAYDFFDKKVVDGSLFCLPLFTSILPPTLTSTTAHIPTPGPPHTQGLTTPQQTTAHLHTQAQQTSERRRRREEEKRRIREEERVAGVLCGMYDDLSGGMGGLLPKRGQRQRQRQGATGGGQGRATGRMSLRLTEEEVAEHWDALVGVWKVGCEVACVGGSGSGSGPGIRGGGGGENEDTGNINVGDDSALNLNLTLNLNRTLDLNQDLNLNLNTHILTSTLQTLLLAQTELTQGFSRLGVVKGGGEGVVERLVGVLCGVVSKSGPGPGSRRDEDGDGKDKDKERKDNKKGDRGIEEEKRRLYVVKKLWRVFVNVFGGGSLHPQSRAGQGQGPLRWAAEKILRVLLGDRSVRGDKENGESESVGVGSGYSERGRGYEYGLRHLELRALWIGLCGELVWVCGIPDSVLRDLTEMGDMDRRGEMRRCLWVVVTSFYVASLPEPKEREESLESSGSWGGGLSNANANNAGAGDWDWKELVDICCVPFRDRKDGKSEVWNLSEEEEKMWVGMFGRALGLVRHRDREQNQEGCESEEEVLRYFLALLHDRDGAKERFMESRICLTLVLRKIGRVIFCSTKQGETAKQRREKEGKLIDFFVDSLEVLYNSNSNRASSGSGSVSSASQDVAFGVDVLVDVFSGWTFLSPLIESLDGELNAKNLPSTSISLSTPERYRHPHSPTSFMHMRSPGNLFDLEFYGRGRDFQSHGRQRHHNSKEEQEKEKERREEEKLGLFWILERIAVVLAKWLSDPMCLVGPKQHSELVRVVYGRVLEVLEVCEGMSFGGVGEGREEGKGEGEQGDTMALLWKFEDVVWSVFERVRTRRERGLERRQEAQQQGEQNEKKESERLLIGPETFVEFWRRIGKRRNARLANEVKESGRGGGRDKAAGKPRVRLPIRLVAGVAAWADMTGEESLVEELSLSLGLGSGIWSESGHGSLGANIGAAVEARREKEQEFNSPSVISDSESSLYPRPARHGNLGLDGKRPVNVESEAGIRDGRPKVGANVYSELAELVRLGFPLGPGGIGGGGGLGLGGVSGRAGGQGTGVGKAGKMSNIEAAPPVNSKSDLNQSCEDSIYGTGIRKRLFDDSSHYVSHGLGGDGPGNFVRDEEGDMNDGRPVLKKCRSDNAASKSESGRKGHRDGGDGDASANESGSINLIQSSFEVPGLGVISTKAESKVGLKRASSGKDGGGDERDHLKKRRRVSEDGSAGPSRIVKVQEEEEDSIEDVDVSFSSIPGLVAGKSRGRAGVMAGVLGKGQSQPKGQGQGQGKTQKGKGKAMAGNLLSPPSDGIEDYSNSDSIYHAGRTKATKVDTSGLDVEEEIEDIDDVDSDDAAHDREQDRKPPVTTEAIRARQSNSGAQPDRHNNSEAQQNDWLEAQQDSSEVYWQNDPYGDPADWGLDLSKNGNGNENENNDSGRSENRGWASAYDNGNGNDGYHEDDYHSWEAGISAEELREVTKR